jgi:HK97 family phage prohead protease
LEAERRRYALAGPVILRAKDGGALRFEGHAAVFDQRTWIGDPAKRWGWWEQVAGGAFSRAVAEDDVVFLYNHNDDTVMARTTSGSLTLAEDKVGLRVRAALDPADVDVARLVPKLERGDVNKMSFAFTVSKESWEILDDGDELRTIEAVEPLWDVSAVTFPAYDGTDAALRAKAEARRSNLTHSRLLAVRRRLASLKEES